MSIRTQLSLLFLCVIAGSSYAQTTTGGSGVASTNTTATSVVGPPDVYLNASVSVGLIQLIVENLNVSLNLDLKAANLVTLNAGVQATIQKINLTIENIQVDAQLTIRLDNVVKVVEDTLRVIEKNPQILTGLLNAVGTLVGDVVSDLAGVLTQTVNALGQVVQTVVDDAGNLITQTLDSSGNVVSQTLDGNVAGLQVLSALTNASGQYVTTVRGTDGSTIQLTYTSKSGTLISAQTLQSGTTSTTTTGGSSSTTTGTA